MIKNNILLRIRYGNFKNICAGYLLGFLYFIKHFSNVKYFANNNISNLLGLKNKKTSCNEKNRNFQPFFHVWNYEYQYNFGYRYKNRLEDDNWKVSILVRTLGNKNLLTEALTSIRNQTYRNIEVVLVEDGGETLSSFIHDYFNDLNIKYISTDSKVGRSNAGNIALKSATGEYINFLDDDDILMPDHVEILLNEIISQKYHVGYSLAIEAPLEPEPISRQFEYKKHYFSISHLQEHNIYELQKSNYLPIQSVMFSREVYLQCGGLDSHLEALEDWDLWLKFAKKYDFLFVKKVTSIYRVPFNAKDYMKRKNKIKNTHSQIQMRYAEKNVSNVSGRNITKTLNSLKRNISEWNVKIISLKIRRYLSSYQIRFFNRG